MYANAAQTWGLWTLTWLKLDPDSCIVLNLLDHLPVSADDDSHCESGHCHLCAQTSNQHTRPYTAALNEAGAERVLTSMLLPSLEPKSLRPLRKSPWSFSLMISTTSSRACCTEHTLRVRHETLEHRTTSSERWIKQLSIDVWFAMMQKNLNIEKITFKDVQMAFLAMHINNQKYILR